MKKLLVAMLLVMPLGASAVEYSKVQADRSSISFVSKQMSVPVEGVFKKFAAHMRINPARPEAGMAHIEIDLASIDAGSAEANDEVKGKSWFSVAEFPKAEFVSSAVKSLGGGKFEAAGKMTIKGKTLEVRAPFTLKEDKGALNIDGAFTLKRLDFGIGSGLWSDTSVVADEVQIKFHLMLK
jgi:polyisoprenoid-binding protein YceI